jgi:hypothetical protein
MTRISSKWTDSSPLAALDAEVVEGVGPSPDFSDTGETVGLSLTTVGAAGGASSGEVLLHATTSIIKKENNRSSLVYITCSPHPKKNS